MKTARKFICIGLAAIMSAALLCGCSGNGDSEYNIFEDYSSDVGDNGDNGDTGDIGDTGEDEWQYYGCWKNENREVWVIIYEDFTYEMYWGADETGMKGEYELLDGMIRLDTSVTYTPDGEGNLVSSGGDRMYSAEPPLFIYDITFEDD